MKNNYIYKLMFFAILLLGGCRSSIELYTSNDGCVIYDNLKNIKLNGDIDTSYLGLKPPIKWNLIYIVEDKFFKDKVLKFDSLIEIGFIDSNTILLSYSSYYIHQVDTVELLNLSINKKFKMETVFYYKNIDIVTNKGMFELKLLYLQYPIAIIYSKGRKEYYIFKASNNY